jgi:putative amino-acid transport system ATP-binding protein
LRCINFLTKPTAGKIIIDGFTVDSQNSTKKDILELRQKTAMVFQNYNLLKNKTAIANIMEPLIIVQKKHKKEAEEIAINLLKKVGLLEKRDFYPKELSGGQQQRIGIARAMAVNADVILFDEPTSSLDPELVGEVLAVIKQLTLEHNKTMLIATHEMKFAQEVADKVIFLENGSIISEGTSTDIFLHCKNNRIKRFVSEIADIEYEV